MSASKCSLVIASHSSAVSSAWISAIASVSSCLRCSASRSRAATRRTASAARASSSGCSASRWNPAAQACRIGSISECSASIASSVARPSSSARSISAGQRPASSPLWWWCSAEEKISQRSAIAFQARRSEAGVVPAAVANASRSRRKAWCMTYIIVMSIGPGWAAVWPGSRSCSGQVVVSVVIGFSFLA